MSFSSYYWTRAQLQDADLTRACRRLSISQDTAELGEALRTLLRSSSTAAQCIALDHYAYMESIGRHGCDNPFASIADEVQACARAQLRAAPVEMTDTQPMPDIAGANHASALFALLNLATVEDCELIANALRRSRSTDILLNGTMAARRALADAGQSVTERKPDDTLVTTLRDIILDAGLPVEVRDAAIMAYADCRTPEITEILIEVTQLPELRQQATAAWLLTDDLDAHRERLERLVASWPQDAPYPASEVISILTEE